MNRTKMNRMTPPKQNRPGRGTRQNAEKASWEPQESMNHSAGVKVLSRDYPRRVDAQGKSAQACARDIEHRDAAVASAEEAVVHIVRVNGVARNGVRRVKAVDSGALVGTCAHARSIEGGDTAIWSSKEAVVHIARI